ncbi:hypothetical protein EES39_40335 [Streptomyces sp. ADI92-24]|uniref:hypothetical protein n=1 Tax=Streptomyces sp. ADI92-24 TaxID=1522756 RepID=UPI000F553500|nr:hypothetical protein [Streptomyces sp. ADI92-24]RPK29195.1 hypothetical protein EES39_40335 [Streptomyces sp. ADI92-24]
MTTPEENLGPIFARPTANTVPNRAQGLGGLVPGRGTGGTPPPQSPTGSTPSPPKNPEGTGETPPPAAPSGGTPPPQTPPIAEGPPPQAPAEPPEAVEAEEGETEAALAKTKHRTTLYVSPALHRRFEKYVRAARGRTNTSAVLEAVAAKNSTTPQIIQESKVSVAAGNDLFPEDPRAVRYLGAGPVQIQIAPTYAQLQVLDTLTVKYGFEARATWIAPVLNAFLPGKKEKVPE